MTQKKKAGKGPRHAKTERHNQHVNFAKTLPKGAQPKAETLAKLTPLQRLYIIEYLVDLNQTQAAIRAGYAPGSAKAKACDLMKNPRVKAEIDKAMQARVERTEITADKVLQHWWDIATADPNEIIHLRRVCCRHCYGIGHQFQWRDEGEYQKAVQMAMDEAEKKAEKDEGEARPPVIPSNAGGYGFKPLLKPHPDCPYCQGEGHPEVHIEDTRNLGPQARLLYAGIKQTATGIEVKFRDQDKAMENVARHLGMFTEKHSHEHTGKDGKPIEHRVVSRAAALSDEELDVELTRLDEEDDDSLDALPEVEQ